MEITFDKWIKELKVIRDKIDDYADLATLIDAEYLEIVRRCDATLDDCADMIGDLVWDVLGNEDPDDLRWTASIIEKSIERMKNDLERIGD